MCCFVVFLVYRMTNAGIWESSKLGRFQIYYCNVNLNYDSKIDIGFEIDTDKLFPCFKCDRKAYVFCGLLDML